MEVNSTRRADRQMRDDFGDPLPSAFLSNMCLYAEIKFTEKTKTKNTFKNMQIASFPPFPPVIAENIWIPVSCKWALLTCQYVDFFLKIFTGSPANDSMLSLPPVYPRTKSRGFSAIQKPIWLIPLHERTSHGRIWPTDNHGLTGYLFQRLLRVGTLNSIAPNQSYLAYNKPTGICCYWLQNRSKYWNSKKFQRSWIK